MTPSLARCRLRQVLANALKQHPVGLEEVDDGNVLLGRVDERDYIPSVLVTQPPSRFGRALRRDDEAWSRPVHKTPRIVCKQRMVSFERHIADNRIAERVHEVAYASNAHDNLRRLSNAKPTSG